jgi:hypothetical protein
MNGRQRMSELSSLFGYEWLIFDILNTRVVNILGSVVELVIKLIICLAIITFFIPNHILS